MTARRTLARGVSAMPLADLTWRLRRRRRGAGRALILMYHRISNDPDYLGLSVAPQYFDAQIGLLRRRTKVLPLGELVARLARKQGLDEDLAAITFDDGYRDNFEVALPILERHGVPATVFVTTGFVDDAVLPVGDRLWRAVEVLWTEPSTFPRFTNTAITAAVRQTLAKPGSLETLRGLRQQLKVLPVDETEQVVATLEQLTGVSKRESRPLPLMLTWHEVRVLAARGVEIGSHTVSHPILSRIPETAAVRELRESKQRLEDVTGKPVMGFAYPNGQAADFSQAHVTALVELGYTHACSAVRGVNRPGSDTFRLRRIGVGNDSAAMLDLKLALGGPVQPPCAA